MHKLKIDYKIESNKAVKVNNSIICFKTDNRNGLRGLVFDYLLIDETSFDMRYLNAKNDGSIIKNIQKYILKKMRK